MPKKNIEVDRESFRLAKEYLRTGDLAPLFNLPPETLATIPLNTLQALALRRSARMADEDALLLGDELEEHLGGVNSEAAAEPLITEYLGEIDSNKDKALDLRNSSREVNDRISEVLDYEIVDYIMSEQDLDYGQIFQFLRAQGVTELPILSTTPDSLIAECKNHFPIKIIPADQLSLTNFNNIVGESEIPEWFKEYQAKQGNEYVNIFSALRERWFLLVIVLLGILSAVGFSLNLGVELQNIFYGLDIFFSVYGAVAVGRAGWQINRAEKWNRQARSYTRPEYTDAFQRIAARQGDLDLGDDFFEKLNTLADKNIGWDEFKQKFGIYGDETEKKSFFDEYQAAQSKVGNKIDTNEFINQLAEDIIEHTLHGETPTVAIVIPTYKVTQDELRRLLASIKNQAYPVTNAYIVYNDNPNDPTRKDQKQAEFLSFQALVNQANQTEGRNNCQFHLLAQPSRGKREAMGYGFALGRGKELLNDLKHKHPDVPEEELYGFMANLDLQDLPDFKHDRILNIDSDTELADPLAILNAELQFHHYSLNNPNERLACTTGDVRVMNRDFNHLTEMTFQRYWRAFFVERAAQALSGEVTCASGPFVYMDSEALANIFDDWYYQTSLGIRSTFGDDRNLTTRFLENGYKTLFSPDSAVLTDCPTTWRQFLKQQLRWNKSFNRENFIVFKFLHKLDKFVQLDVVYQQTFAFVMLYIMASITGKAINISQEQGILAGLRSVLPYAVTVVLYNELFFGLYGAIKNKDAKYFYSPTYIGYHFTTLIWLKFWAFVKWNDTQWGTRGDSAVDEEELQDKLEQTLAEAADLLAEGDQYLAGMQTKLDQDEVTAQIDNLWAETEHEMDEFDTYRAEYRRSHDLEVPAEYDSLDWQLYDDYFGKSSDDIDDSDGEGL